MNMYVYSCTSFSSILGISSYHLYQLALIDRSCRWQANKKKEMLKILQDAMGENTYDVFFRNYVYVYIYIMMYV